MMMERKKEKGMTLVEVLAAVVILSLVLSTSLAVFTNSKKTSTQDNEQLQATQLAQYILESWTGDTTNNSYDKLKSRLTNGGGNSQYPSFPEAISAGSAYWPQNQNYQGFTAMVNAKYLTDPNSNNDNPPIQIDVTVFSPNHIVITLHTVVLPPYDSNG